MQNVWNLLFCETCALRAQDKQALEKITHIKKTLFRYKFLNCIPNKYMNVDSYLTHINCCTTFKKGNFEIMSIYLHWKLKVKVDKYYEAKIIYRKILPKMMRMWTLNHLCVGEIVSYFVPKQFIKHRLKLVKSKCIT